MNRGWRNEGCSGNTWCFDERAMRHFWPTLGDTGYSTGTSRCIYAESNKATEASEGDEETSESAFKRFSGCEYKCK